jgi:hypothetical protein
LAATENDWLCLLMTCRKPVFLLTLLMFARCFYPTKERIYTMVSVRPPYNLVDNDFEFWRGKLRCSASSYVQLSNVSVVNEFVTFAAYKHTSTTTKLKCHQKDKSNFKRFIWHTYIINRLNAECVNGSNRQIFSVITPRKLWVSE